MHKTVLELFGPGKALLYVLSHPGSIFVTSNVFTARFQSVLNDISVENDDFLEKFVQKTRGASFSTTKFTQGEGGV